MSDDDADSLSCLEREGRVRRGMLEGRREDFGEGIFGDMGLNSSSALLHLTKERKKKRKEEGREGEDLM